MGEDFVSGTRGLELMMPAVSSPTLQKTKGGAPRFRSGSGRSTAKPGPPAKTFLLQIPPVRRNDKLPETGLGKRRGTGCPSYVEWPS